MSSLGTTLHFYDVQVLLKFINQLFDIYCNREWYKVSVIEADLYRMTKKQFLEVLKNWLHISIRCIC